MKRRVIYWNIFFFFVSIIDSSSFIRVLPCLRACFPSRFVPQTSCNRSSGQSFKERRETCVDQKKNIFSYTRWKIQRTSSNRRVKYSRNKILSSGFTMGSVDNVSP
nr:hypothetical protein [Trentepohlia sp. YN1317]